MGKKKDQPKHKYTLKSAKLSARVISLAPSMAFLSGEDILYGIENYVTEALQFKILK